MYLCWRWLLLSDLACHALIEQDIPGCQVSVDEALPGQILHPFSDLPGRSQEEVLDVFVPIHNTFAAWTDDNCLNVCNNSWDLFIVDTLGLMKVSFRCFLNMRQR